ncbi:MAG: T9SS type A sorting domain-containing protein [Bacteroidota bacterium]
MQRLIPVLLFLLYTVSLSAQPIITSEVLPNVGDTILLANDNLPEGIAILGEGADQSWDLTGLQSAFTQKVAIRAVSKKSRNPPFATNNTITQEVSGINSFYQKNDRHSLDLLGSIGLDPMNMGVQTVTHFDQPLQTAHFPLKYGSKKVQEGSFHFKVATNDLPKEILYTLPVSPDSVRYRCFFKQEKIVDGWGTLALPDNTFEVLRELQTEERRYEVDVKVGEAPWKEVTETVDDPKIQNKQVLRSFHFYSNETTSKVAVAYMKPNGVNPETVFYTVTDPASTVRATNGRADIYAYPNPAIQYVRFEFSNLKPSNYSLKIYNILGVVVMEKAYDLSGFKTIKLDVSKLRKGTYLYSLSDGRGKTVATRRLMIIRP